jgi:hypothetical protein
MRRVSGQRGKTRNSKIAYASGRIQPFPLPLNQQATHGFKPSRLEFVQAKERETEQRNK